MIGILLKQKSINDIQIIKKEKKRVKHAAIGGRSTYE